MALFLSLSSQTSKDDAYGKVELDEGGFPTLFVAGKKKKRGSVASLRKKRYFCLTLA
jgi:hypothetical protein